VSGIQEILVVIFILLVILYLPKRTMRNGGQVLAKSNTPVPFRVRLAIVISLVWLATAAGVVHMLARDWTLFGYFGAAPVLLAWGIAWVAAGRRRR